jgi:magnesium transporter
METKNESLRKKLIYSQNKDKIFKKIDDQEKIEVLNQLSVTVQKKILDQIGNEEIANFLKFSDLDEATDVLQIVKKSRRKEILKKLEREAREKIEMLLKFDRESAAGLITLDYIQVNKDATLEEVLTSAEKHEKKTGKFPIILVANKGLLVGEFPLYSIPKLNKEDQITNYIKKVPKIDYNMKSKEIPKILKRHSHNKLVVVDKDDDILGIVYAHDVLKLIDESRDIEKFAGVSKEENVYDGFLSKIKHRYKWLIINLFTAFLAASVVSLFEETISKFVLLAIYMPIVAGMGGNAGTQSLAVFVRGITLGEIELNKNAVKAIFNEALAGVFNGLIVGTLAALVALTWNKSPVLGVVIGVAMTINLAIAGFFGALIPLIMKKIGKDPATSATIFITTATDVLGFFAFLGLASLLL